MYRVGWYGRLWYEDMGEKLCAPGGVCVCTHLIRIPLATGSWLMCVVYINNKVKPHTGNQLLDSIGRALPIPRGKFKSLP